MSRLTRLTYEIQRLKVWQGPRVDAVRDFPRLKALLAKCE